MSDLLEPPRLDDQSVGDPIDALLPRPRPTWVRLLIGLVIVGSVGAIGFLWGQGYIRPQPDCCGGGGGSSNLSLTTDGEAVTIDAYFFNSSGRDLIIRSATAELPGADVLDVQVLPDSDGRQYPVPNAEEFPARVQGRGYRQVLVTFVPLDCSAMVSPWGSVTLELDVDSGWLPSIGASHDIAVLQQQSDLSVFPPAAITVVRPGPLGAACDLLGR